MQIPLEKRLRKRAHREIGMLQDEVLEILYSISPDFVLHGGTAIWRCYGGSRFSDDLDLYHRKPGEGLEGKLRQILSSRGLALDKFKRTQNLIFCKITSPEAEVKVEVNFAKAPAAVPVSYEKMNGSSMIVLSLSPERLIVEKAEAYLSRKLIRDIYDVYFLSLLPSMKKSKIFSAFSIEQSSMTDAFCRSKMHMEYRNSNTMKETKEAKDAIAKLCRNTPPPLDEDNLAAIVFSGAIPAFRQMLNHLQGRFK